MKTPRKLNGASKKNPEIPNIHAPEIILEKRLVAGTYCPEMAILAAFLQNKHNYSIFLK